MLNEYNLNGKIIQYETITRKIKNPRLDISKGHLTLIIPPQLENPEQLIEQNKKWILSKIEIIENSQNTTLNTNRTQKQLETIIQKKITQYTQKYKNTPQTITYRKMKKRWGSCDSEKNIKFNKTLKYLPEQLINYIIFHEYCHLEELSHNKNFKKLVSREYPNYKQLDKEISTYWMAIQKIE